MASPVLKFEDPKSVGYNEHTGISVFLTAANTGVIEEYSVRHGEHGVRMSAYRDGENIQFFPDGEISDDPQVYIDGLMEVFYQVADEDEGGFYVVSIPRELAHVTEVLILNRMARGAGSIGNSNNIDVLNVIYRPNR